MKKYISLIVYFIAFPLTHQLQANECKLESFLNHPETNHRKHHYRTNINNNLEYLNQKPEASSEKVAEKIFDIGRSYFMLGKMDSAQYCLSEAGKQYFKNNNHQQGQNCNSFIALIHADNGLYDSALFYNQIKLEYYIAQKDTQNLIRTYCDLISNKLYKGDYRNSTTLIREALTISNLVNDSLSSAVLYATIADFYFEKENYVYAKKYYDKSVNIWNTFERQAKNLHLERLVNLSVTEVKLGNHAQAIERAKEAITYAERIGFQHQRALGYTGLGQVYKDVGDIDSAICMYLKALETGCSACPELSFHEHIIELGELYIIKNEFSNALKIFRISESIALPTSSKKLIATSKFHIGKTYFLLKNYQKAATYFQPSLIISKKHNYQVLSIKNTNYLSKVYNHLGNNKLAYQYSIQNAEQNALLLKNLKDNNQAELEFRLVLDDYIAEKETEWRVKELEANAHFNNLKRNRNSLLAFVIFLALFSTYIYINFRRKKKDNRLLKTQKEEIERISQELHEADKSKLRFFTNLSHEFRTPLTLILHPLEKLIKSPHSGGEQEQYKLIFNNALKIKQLIDQVLDLRKMDDGEFTLNNSDIDIVSATKNTVGLFDEYCHKSDCNLSFYSNHSSIIISFDLIKWQSIVNNLLSNAFRYNKPGGKVEINLTIQQKELKLSVIDSGIGISKKDQTRIFERYYKQSNANTDIEGTGIGLAYVNEIIQAIKGKIEVQSLIGEGSGFVVTIPLQKVDIKEKKNLHLSIKANPQVKLNHLENTLNNTFNTDKPAVLIVEDNIDLQNNLKEIFCQKYRVLSANNGIEGKEMALQHIPDLIISDIMMPELNGNQLCSYLKQNEQTCHIPIILLTAKDSEMNHKEGYQSGANDYIVKPFNAELLLRKADNIIQTLNALKAKVQIIPGGITNTQNYSEIDNRFIKKCISLIEENMDKSDFSIEQLANKLAFSSRNFYRKSKALFNLPPAEFVKSYKMEYAANLFRNNGMRVSEVALKVGYEDSKRFSQAFKKQFGVTPSQYSARKVS